MEDTLLAEIAMTLLFIAVRARAWKASKELELNELLGYFISLSIYFIVPFMASSFVRFVLDLPFNRNINHPLVFIVLSFLLKFAVSLFSVWLIEKKVLNKIVLLEEKKIYTIQLGVSLAIIIAVAEILREMDILGIVSIIMLGFLIAQYAITLFLTYI
ncbi:histidine kinase, partial [Enterococcus durans]